MRRERVMNVFYANTSGTIASPPPTFYQDCQKSIARCTASTDACGLDQGLGRCAANGGQMVAVGGGWPKIRQTIGSALSARIGRHGGEWQEWEGALGTQPPGFPKGFRRPRHTQTLLNLLRTSPDPHILFLPFSHSPIFAAAAAHHSLLSSRPLSFFL